MADENDKTPDVRAAKAALLKRIVDDAPNDQGKELKELALAYRLLAGGPQPGSSVVEGK